MRRSHTLLVALALLVGAGRAYAQQPMQPYDEAQAPQPMEPYPSAPAGPPMVMPPAPPLVPPPLVVPPPGYYQQPYYFQQPMAFAQPRLFHEEMQPNYGLMVAGLVILGASWSINAASAYLADEWKLAVPVVGPFLETQNINTGGGNDDNRFLVGLLVFDGLIETAGAVMLVAGALTHHKVRVYDRQNVSVSVVPTAGPASAGLAAFGRF
ncbi:MAG TPA: hypothetical protein VGL86_16070 [Polyangia bacterium]